MLVPRLSMAVKAFSASTEGDGDHNKKKDSIKSGKRDAATKRWKLAKRSSKHTLDWKAFSMDMVKEARDVPKDTVSKALRDLLHASREIGR